MRILAALGVLVALLIAGVWGGGLLVFGVSSLHQIPAEGIIVEIHKGQSQKDLTHTLVQAGVIPASQEENFLLLGKVSRYWKKVKAGEYKFTPTMTPLNVFSTLASGLSIFHPITVREGENMYEVADAIEASSLAKKEKILDLCRDSKFIASVGLSQARTLEGFLFPDTYFFNKTMSAEEMLRQMVKHFHSVWSQQDEARARQLGMNQFQVITLASIIEKETGVAQERPIISGVFHNRLKKKMRLQSDPTTIYGMWDRYRGKIHKTDLSAVNDYNTYSVPALPAGPISNPGKEAIQAALHPTDSEYLYFVSHNDGTHQFSKTFEEHNRAVKQFQLDPKAREGKSWRDAIPKKTK